MSSTQSRVPACERIRAQQTAGAKSAILNDTANVPSELSGIKLGGETGADGDAES